jgi:nucleotide-binding universal stress UspA family protein
MLIAVDGSKPSERFKAHLGRERPVHSSPGSQSPAGVGAATLAEEKREDLRLHLEAMERATRSAKSLLTEAGISWKSVLRVGDAAEKILERVPERHCGHIVTGTRGRGAVSRSRLRRHEGAAARPRVRRGGRA